MKALRSRMVLIASLMATGGLPAQTITGYGVIKTYEVTQTSTASPVAASATPYLLGSYVFGSGLTSGYLFISPGGTALSPQLLTNDTSKAEFNSIGFASPAALNAAYNDGVYTMTFPNTQGASTASLPSFSGDAFPEVPMISSGTWVGGMLQVDPTLSYTLSFVPFTSFLSDDSYALTIRNSSDVTVASGFWNTSGTTNFVIAPGTLTYGFYSASLQFNNNSINYNTPFAGANGNVGYTVINDFQIQAVPEPSTLALLALGGGWLFAACRRRRSA